LSRLLGALKADHDGAVGDPAASESASGPTFFVGIVKRPVVKLVAPRSHVDANKG